MSAIVTVALMCIREGSKRATEKDEQEEMQLLEEFSDEEDPYLSD